MLFLGKAVSVEGLGTKTRLTRVEEKMGGEDAKTASLDNSFKAFGSLGVGGVVKEMRQYLERGMKSKEGLFGFSDKR